MHGLGNDFIVIDAINQDIQLQSTQISTLADRHTGIGFDQCLLIEASTRQGIDFNYRIFNANGSEVGQCGNGARCIARFIQAKKLSQKNPVTVQTKTTTMRLFTNDDSTCTVTLGKPLLEPKDIPLNAKHRKSYYELKTDFGSFKLHALNIGNPHGILLADNIDSIDVEKIGQALSEHSMFPEHANISVMKRVSKNEIQLRVYERGVGETQACGSAAVASAICGRLFHNMESNINITLKGGTLSVIWPDMNDEVMLKGKANFVYDGETYS
jgi:diaminopimelate epimerase